MTLVIIIVYGKKSAIHIGQSLSRLKYKHIMLNPDEIPRFKYSHIILSGGPKHVYDDDHYPLPQWVMDSNVQVLGICYGMQLIAKKFGGRVIAMNEREHGCIPVTEIKGDKQIIVNRWMNRRDRIATMPRGFSITAVTNKNHIAAFTDRNKWWGVQYHPESEKCPDDSIFISFLQKNINFTNIQSSE